jgi:hypothetical protein
MALDGIFDIRIQVAVYTPRMNFLKAMAASILSRDHLLQKS